MYIYFLIQENQENCGMKTLSNLQFPFPFVEAFSAPVFVSGPDRNGFSLGLRKNLLQVFGEDRKLWFIPFFTR